MGKKKKEKNPYPRSFAGRLTWRIVLTLFVVMGITSYMIYELSSVAMSQEAELYCSERLNNRSLMIQQALSDVCVATFNLVPEIEKNLGKPDRLQGIMELMLKQNPSIRSCGISFVENYYPTKGRWFCPYAVRDSSQNITTCNKGSAQYDYLSHQWFLEAIKAEEGYWSKPFYGDTDSSEMLTAYLMPIHNQQDSTVAVLGVDLSLDKLYAKLLKGSLKIGLGLNSEDEKGQEGSKAKSDSSSISKYVYYFIIDKDGTYITHPDKNKVLQQSYVDDAKLTPDTLDDYIGRLMTTGKEGVVSTDKNDNDLLINGDAYYIFYTPIPQTNWSMGLTVRSLMVRMFGYILGGLLLFLIVVGLLVTFLVARFAVKRAVKPVKLLANSAKEVAQGHFDTPLPVVKRRDELCLLRDSFEQMQHSLTQYVDELKITTAQKSAIESELKIAHDIQMSMLPKIYPPFPERNDVDVYGMLTPAKGVGGDLFDFFIRDEKLFFCIGDVSGKGIPAALVMAVTRSLFRNIASYATRPNEIVSALNSALSDGNETIMFVTIFVGVLDLATGRLHYCNGGHESPLLVGRDVGTLPCDANLAAGVVNGFTFSMQEADIDSGTTIFLYTDGLNEAENAQHAQFGEQRIFDVANQMLDRGTHDPLSLIREMNEAVHHFVGGAEQSDDLTMLAIQYNKPQQTAKLQRSITLNNNLDEVPQLAAFVDEVCEEAGLDMSLTMSLNLAIEEAVVNVIDYAYPEGTPGKVCIEAVVDDQQLSFVISDWGVPFDPTTRGEVDTTLSVDERPIGGLGIHLVRQIMDSISYERTDEKNVLTLRKKLV